MSEKLVLRNSLWLLATFLLASVHLAEAQQPKVYRVGVLFIGSPNSPALNGLRNGLKEAGYVEGKNLLLSYPDNKTHDELRSIANSYKEQKIDVIVTFGSTATAIAKEATQEIPIVFIFLADPVQAGFVKSLARPETNITGLTTYPDSELHGKRLEIFKSAVPTLRRVVVLYNARTDSPASTMYIGMLQKAAPNLGLKIVEKPIKLAAEVEQALSSVSKETADGLFLVCSSLFREGTKQIATLAIKKALPLMGCDAVRDIELGALVAYEADRYRLSHRGAWYVDRIFKGAKPQELPVETPTKFQLVINLKTAKQIGLTIPPNVLAQADKVIK